MLTIGFARRVPTYKRLTLMLRDPDRLEKLLLDEKRPIQLIVAGKSHPADDGGKALIQQVVRFADRPEVRHRIAFLPDYDMSMARQLYWGCDVWLNNPLRPLEACGTSGMKSALNGGLNLSIRDGWWDEWYDGENGWEIPTADGLADESRRDDLEAAALYDLLEQSVAPEVLRPRRARRADAVGRDGAPHPAGAGAEGAGVADGARLHREVLRAGGAVAAHGPSSPEVGGREPFGAARELAAYRQRAHERLAEDPDHRRRQLRAAGHPAAGLGADADGARCIWPVCGPTRWLVQAVLGRVDASDALVDPVTVPMAHTGTADGGKEIFSDDDAAAGRRVRSATRSGCCRITRCWPVTTSSVWSPWRERHGNRLKQRSSSPSTPTRNASIRENPDGTDSPLTSLAARPLVEHAGHRLVDVTGRQRDGVAVGRGDCPCDILTVATPVRQAVRSAASALSRTRPPRCVLDRQHVPGHQHRIRGVVAGGHAACSSCSSDRVPITSSSGRSTTMVLVAGQKDTGGLGRASGQVSASAASKLSCGGSAGENRMLHRVDDRPHRLLGDRQFAGLILGQQHGQIAAALVDLLRRRSPRTHAGPSVKPNWNAESRSNAEPCSSTPASGSPSAQQWIAERDHRRQHVVQPFTGAQREARRIVLGHPAHVRAGEAVGLLLADQRRGALACSARPAAAWRGRTRGPAPSSRPCRRSASRSAGSSSPRSQPMVSVVG